MRQLRLTTVLAIAALGGTWALLANKESKPEKAATFATTLTPVNEARIARGKYLVGFGGCADCHTPMKMTPRGPEPDPALHLAGHPASMKLPPPPKLENTPWFATTAGLTAWSGPWGISYAANLTPDNHTGLGIWTEEMFIDAMRKGKHMGSGRDILPPMPTRSVAMLTDEDLKSVYAYLRSIPAIKNRVPDPLGPDGMPYYE